MGNEVQKALDDAEPVELVATPQSGPAKDKKSEINWELVRQCAELDQNDRDNGRRLMIWDGKDLTYVPGMGWLAWRGAHWQRDEGDLLARMKAQDLVDRIKLEPGQLRLTADEKASVDRAGPYYNIAVEDRSESQRDAVATATKAKAALARRRAARRKFAISSGNSAKTAGLLAQASSHAAVDPDVLDANRRLFNVQNGTLEFERVEDPECPDPDVIRHKGSVAFRANERADMNTKCAEVTYDPDAQCPGFMKFLARVQPEASMRRFLQVFHAYALMLGGNDEQKLVFHYGLGANGKSMFIEVTGRLAGTYRAVVSPDTLTGDAQRQGSQASGDIARLHNARYVTVEEMPRNAPLREDLIKAVSGGGKMTARFLQREFFEFEPIFTAVLTGNTKPTIQGSDDGIWRRVLLVEWGEKISDEERVPWGEMLESLLAERAGILNWLIEGAKIYLSEGLDAQIPASVTAFTSDYRAERDNVGVFAEKCCVREPDSRVGAGVMYKAYTDFCETNGLPVAKQRTFGSRMGELGWKKERARLYTYLDVRVLSSQLYDQPDSGPAPGF
jgi:putative DNA primase/helicase